MQIPKMLLFNLLFVSLFLIVQVYCRSNGAPQDACQTMKPRHGSNQPQPDSTNPYRLTVNLIPESNEKIVYIHLESVDQKTAFRGFMVQARLANKTNVIVDGTFVPYGKNSRTFRCKDKEEKGDDTWTHSNNHPKQNVSSFWFLGDQSVQELVFVATVAKDGKTFWMDIRSETIRFEPIQNNELVQPENNGEEEEEGASEEGGEGTETDPEQPVTEDGGDAEGQPSPDAELAIGEENPCEDENDCQPDNNDIEAEPEKNQEKLDEQPEPSNNVDRFASSSLTINRMNYTSFLTLIISLFIYRTLI